MTSTRPSLGAALRSPLLPCWLVIALLPIGRSAELGTALCLIGVVMLFVRFPHALGEHAGARCLLVMLACYVGAALLSALDAVAPGKSWGTVAGLLRYVPLGLYACFAMRREGRVHALYRAVAVVVALWALDAWVQALTGWSLGGKAEAERISGIFGADNLKLGPTLAVLSPFVLWAARERWGARALWLTALVLLGPVLLAGARSAWIAYGLVVLAFAWREAGSWRRFALFGLAAALAAAVAGGVAWKVSDRFQARMVRTLAVFDGGRQGLDEALTGRLDIWRASARMVAAHPVNGVGVRGFRYAYPDFAPANDHFVTAEACGVGEGACHAHQVVLEVLTETGVLGLLAWLGALAVGWRYWRSVPPAARARAYPAAVALGAMLFPLNTHFAFYSAWWGLLFAWLLGLWCAALGALPEEVADAA